jgi:hypothetical protein
MKLIVKGDRVVVSQCPRILSDGLFEEAAVVKFIVAGDGTTKDSMPGCGSIMDIANMHSRDAAAAIGLQSEP